MDTATAATIESLRQQLDAARRDNEFLRGFINNEDVRSDFRNVTEMRAALDAARADCATCYKAKAKLIDELDAARAESDRIRAALQREYDHSKNLETSLAASQAREEAYRADVVRLTAEVEAVTDLAEQRRNRAKEAEHERNRAESIITKWTEAAFRYYPLNCACDPTNPLAIIITLVEHQRKDASARERSLADVLAAELRAYREWQRTKCDDNASSLDHWHACKALDEATWNTDRTQALDAAKFEVQP